MPKNQKERATEQKQESVRIMGMQDKGAAGDTLTQDERCVGPEDRDCEGKSEVPNPNAKQLKVLLEQQQYCCALSGLPLTPQTCALDHITPRASGGTNAIDNLQWLHEDVNNMKGTLDQGRFIHLCELIASQKS